MMFFGSIVAAVVYFFMGPSPFIQPVLPPTLWLIIITLSVDPFGLGTMLTPGYKHILITAERYGYPNNMRTQVDAMIFLTDTTSFFYTGHG